MKNFILEKLLESSLSLTLERDGDLLLLDILKTAMEITGCDAGTLYVKNENKLDFKIMITKSLNIYQGGRYQEISMPPVEILPTNVCAKALIDCSVINIPNLSKNTQFEFEGPKRYDKLTGYKTKSMLVIPMVSNNDEKIGVLQLMNALDSRGKVIPFDKSNEVYIAALASMAAISIKSLRHKDEMRNLLESLVGALSTAIYIRTPYNVTHTLNMVKYSEKFIDWLNMSDYPWSFNIQRKREFILSVWLHDVGKLTIPLNIMNKKDRLSLLYPRIISRFDMIKAVALIEQEKNKVSADKVFKEVEQAKKTIDYVNTVSFLDDEGRDAILEISEKTYVDIYGKHQKWLEDEEKTALLIKVGTLTLKERKKMERHVVMTQQILENVNFGEEYKNVAKWASQHHMFMNGEGYPPRKYGEELEKESRLLTIIDVFDGLSADDRPYKPPKPLDEVIRILKMMEKEGKLDGEILDLFILSKAWEN